MQEIFSLFLSKTFYSNIYSLFQYLICYCYIQGDFESCADILTSGRAPQLLSIEPIMPYTNVHIFQEKVAKSFSKKKFESL
jgi:hypothetical protein